MSNATIPPTLASFLASPGRFVVIGGGPAGLTAAHAAADRGFDPLVLEKSDRVGGISRTETYKGYGFDMGGHRFVAKSPEVQQSWTDVLAEAGESFLRRPRLSRIFYQGKFFNYPLKRLNAPKNLGWCQSAWLVAAIWKPKHGTIKTLIEEFDYPRRGPGMLWEACAKGIEIRSGEVRMNTAAKTIHREGSRITAVTVESAGGKSETVPVAHAVASMPLTQLVRQIRPEPPLAVLEASFKLKYRDFLTVCVIVDDPDSFPDNWIYVHDPSVQVGRIQNFKNWSPEMVPEAERDTHTSLGMEYFCNEGDSLWSMNWSASPPASWSRSASPRRRRWSTAWSTACRRATRVTTRNMPTMCG